MAISFKGFQPPGFRTKEQPVRTRPECTQIDTEQVRGLNQAELAELEKRFGSTEVWTSSNTAFARFRHGDCASLTTAVNRRLSAALQL